MTKGLFLADVAERHQLKVKMESRLKVASYRMLCPFSLMHSTHCLVVHSGDMLGWYIYCFVIY